MRKREIFEKVILAAGVALSSCKGEMKPQPSSQLQAYYDVPAITIKYRDGTNGQLQIGNNFCPEGQLGVLGLVGDPNDISTLTYMDVAVNELGGPLSQNQSENDYEIIYKNDMGIFAGCWDGSDVIGAHIPGREIHTDIQRVEIDGNEQYTLTHK